MSIFKNKFRKIFPEFNIWWDGEQQNLELVLIGHSWSGKIRFPIDMSNYGYFSQVKKLISKNVDLTDEFLQAKPWGQELSPVKLRTINRWIYLTFS